MGLGSRIAIIGNLCSGKTTLARELGVLLEIPVVHVDSIRFRPNWRRVPANDSDKILKDAARRHRWIIEGFGSNAIIEQRIDLADTVVFIDLPVWRHYWWAAKRQWNARLGQRTELPANCPDFKIGITRKLFSAIWLVNKNHRPWFRELIETKRRVGNIVHIRSPDDRKNFVADVARARRCTVEPEP